MLTELNSRQPEALLRVTLEWDDTSGDGPAAQLAVAIDDARHNRYIRFDGLAPDIARFAYEHPYAYMADHRLIAARHTIPEFVD